MRIRRRSRLAAIPRLRKYAGYRKRDGAATHNLLDAAGFATASYDSPQAVDFRMPGMTGLALYLQLVASGDTIPTVLVTGYQDDAVRDASVQALPTEGQSRSSTSVCARLPISASKRFM